MKRQHSGAAMWVVASNAAQSVYIDLLKCKLPCAPDAGCGVTELRICPEGCCISLVRLLLFMLLSIYSGMEKATL